MATVSVEITKEPQTIKKIAKKSTTKLPNILRKGDNNLERSAKFLLTSTCDRPSPDPRDPAGHVSKDDSHLNGEVIAGRNEDDDRIQNGISPTSIERTENSPAAQQAEEGQTSEQGKMIASTTFGPSERGKKIPQVVKSSAIQEVKEVLQKIIDAVSEEIAYEFNKDSTHFPKREETIEVFPKNKNTIDILPKKEHTTDDVLTKKENLNNDVLPKVEDSKDTLIPKKDVLPGKEDKTHVPPDQSKGDASCLSLASTISHLASRVGGFTSDLENASVEEDSDESEEETMTDSSQNTEKIAASTSKEIKSSHEFKTGISKNDTNVDNDASKPFLSKEKLDSILEKRFIDFFKNVFNADDLEQRFGKIENTTANLRKRHREQDKLLMKIEKSSSQDKKTCNRHVACQTNLGSGSLLHAQQMQNRPMMNNSRNPAIIGKQFSPGPSGITAPIRPSIPGTIPSPQSLPTMQKRSQVVVDLTDEELGPAQKRFRNGNMVSQMNGSSFPPSITTSQQTLRTTHGTGQEYVVPTPIAARSTNPTLTAPVRPVSSALTPQGVQHLLTSGAAKLVTAPPVQSFPLRSVINQYPIPSAPLLQTTAGVGTTVTTSSSSSAYKHPAPLPVDVVHPLTPGDKHPPPKPWLTLQPVPQEQSKGVMLSWNLNLDGNLHSKITKYQLFAYQETGARPATNLWKKVGDDVASMPLPMACTLSQFLPGHNYHFAVRAIDEHCRIGPFSEARSIHLKS